MSIKEIFAAARRYSESAFAREAMQHYGYSNFEFRRCYVAYLRSGNDCSVREWFMM